MSWRCYLWRQCSHKSWKPSSLAEWLALPLEQHDELLASTMIIDRQNGKDWVSLVCEKWLLWPQISVEWRLALRFAIILCPYSIWSLANLTNPGGGVPWQHRIGPNWLDCILTILMSMITPISEYYSMCDLIKVSTTAPCWRQPILCGVRRDLALESAVIGWFNRPRLVCSAIKNASP